MLRSLRRTSPRESVRWTAIWYGPDGAFHEGQIRDVSPAGLFLKPTGERTASVPVGARVRVLFQTPGGVATVAAEGAVRWAGLSGAHQCEGLGVELDDVHPELEAYLNRTSDDAYRAGDGKHAVLAALVPATANES